MLKKNPAMKTLLLTLLPGRAPAMLAGANYRWKSVKRKSHQIASGLFSFSSVQHLGGGQEGDMTDNMNKHEARQTVGNIGDKKGKGV